MTSVGTVGPSLSYAQILANAHKTSTSSGSASSGKTGAGSSADTVTLSDAARAALAEKDFATSDAIRDELGAKGVEVMDGDPLGWDWRLTIG